MKLNERTILLCVNLFVYVLFCRQVRTFRRKVGYFPNIAAPRSFNERMIWRKIFDRNPLFCTFCDKLATKDYIRSRLPEIDIPETLWTGVDVAAIPTALRTGDTVLKANHGCNLNVLGPWEDLQPETLKQTISRWLARDYGTKTCEWGYRGARKLIFLERRLKPREGGKLVDIGVICSNGKAILAVVSIDNKSSDRKVSYYDLEGRRLVEYEPKNQRWKPLPQDFVVPPSFQRAVCYAKKLSVGIDYARYDFIYADNRIYAGEITAYQARGLRIYKFNEELEKGWDIASSWFLSAQHSGWKRTYARVLRKHFEKSFTKMHASNSGTADPALSG